VSSHGLSVADALGLARVLHGARDIRVVAIGISGRPMPGEAMSGAVAAAIPVAMARVRELL
jgi:hypothetical protein